VVSAIPRIGFLIWSCAAQRNQAATGFARSLTSPKSEIVALALRRAREFHCGLDARTLDHDLSLEDRQRLALLAGYESPPHTSRRPVKPMATSARRVDQRLAGSGTYLSSTISMQ
jgi:hypothetical protein